MVIVVLDIPYVQFAGNSQPTIVCSTLFWLTLIYNPNSVIRTIIKVISSVIYFIPSRRFHSNFATNKKYTYYEPYNTKQWG